MSHRAVRGLFLETVTPAAGEKAFSSSELDVNWQLDCVPRGRPLATARSHSNLKYSCQSNRINHYKK